MSVISAVECLGERGTYFVPSFFRLLCEISFFVVILFYSSDEIDNSQFVSIYLEAHSVKLDELTGISGSAVFKSVSDLVRNSFLQKTLWFLLKMPDERNSSKSGIKLTSIVCNIF